MPNSFMHHITINGTNFEIVDKQARNAAINNGGNILYARGEWSSVSGDLDVEADADNMTYIINCPSLSADEYVNIYKRDGAGIDPFADDKIIYVQIKCASPHVSTSIYEKVSGSGWTLIKKIYQVDDDKTFKFSAGADSVLLRINVDSGYALTDEPVYLAYSYAPSNEMLADSISGMATYIDNAIGAVNDTVDSISVDVADKASVISNHASGSLVYFVDGEIGAPLQGMTVDIAPLQSGAGAPSPENIRTITGHTGVYILGPGNQFCEELANWENGKYLDNYGTEKTSTNYKYSKYLYPVRPDTEYAIQIDKGSVANVGYHVMEYDASKAFIRRDVIYGNTTDTGVLSGTFTTHITAAYIRINVPSARTTKIQIEAGDAPTTYKDDAIHVDWQTGAGTIYGGKLAVKKDKSIELTVTHAKINLSDLTWTITTGAHGISYYLSSTITGAKAGPSDTNKAADILCECFPTIGAYAVYTGTDGVGLAPNSRLRVYDGTSNLDTFAETINGMSVVYPLDTPTKVTLASISALPLTVVKNLLWSSIGDLDVSYPIDSTACIDQIREELAPLSEQSNTYYKTGKTLVTFGDSIFGKNAEDGAGVSDFIAQSTGMTVINAAFGGTRVAKRSNDITSGRCAFDFENLVNAIVNDSADFSTRFADQLYAIAHNQEAQISYYVERLNSLGAIDFSQVDYVTLNFGTNDWAGDTAPSTYQSAYISSLVTFLTKYPHIQVIIITPTYRWWVEDDVFSDSNIREYGPVGDKTTLPEFIEQLDGVKTNLNVPIIDLYNIGINRYNRLIYFTAEDGTHHDVAGRRVIGDIIARWMMSH